MIKVYGSSDDLIEIESDDQTKFSSEEFNVDMDFENLISVSDGTLLAIKMNKYGTWRIDILHTGSQFLGVEIWKGQDGSDFAMIDGYPKWIVLGTDFA
jgi:uncharacterized protein YjfI (DUF2170 family)